MVDKNKQRTRIKNDFIAAAKQIIENEGIEKVSARRVGDISGYSYATIYNYFKDINMLLVETSMGYLEDCYQYMMSNLNQEQTVLEQIIQLSKDYFLFMVNNPDIFKIIFVKDFGEYLVEVAKDYSPKAAMLLGIKLSELDPSSLAFDVQIIRGLLSASMHGRILFQINGRGTDSIENALTQMESEIKALLGG